MSRIDYDFDHGKEVLQHFDVENARVVEPEKIKIDYKLLYKTTVQFVHYKHGKLFYKVKLEGTTYQFPVPIEEIGTATFLAEDKANLFKRYIAQAIDNFELLVIAKD